MPGEEFIMSIFWISGFAVGLIFVAIACLLKSRKNTRQGKKDAEYDERQVAARGLCYQKAFFTLLIMLLVFAILTAIFESSPLLQGMFPIMFIAFTGIAVFVCTAIMNDAYFHVGDAQGLSLWLSLGMAVMNTAIGISHIIEGDFLDDAGRFGPGAINMMCGLLFVAVLIALLAKKQKDAKAETEEDDAE